MNGAFYHVHWYKYPLTYGLTSSHRCRLEGGDRYRLSFLKLTPLTDSSLTTISQSGSCHLCHPIAQGACAADAIASAFNMPLRCSVLVCRFAGQYVPFNGVSNESSPLQSSLLVSERMAFKLHRQVIMETIGKNNAVL